jgi:UDP-glucuronate 4-epimerase
MTTLVTGVAGFIGFHVAARLLDDGGCVWGIDNLNAYYDPRLKRARLDLLRARPGFAFSQTDIADRAAMEELFEREKWDLVIHLAAQAGVRYSLENPHAYTESNLTGFLHVLEGCRRARVPHLLYASSSSVYGDASNPVFRVTDRTDYPVSLYAATKKAGELMAHCYTHLFGIPTTGLRLFTVYGPWGRPDMAPFRFARAICRGERIDVYNYGRMRRDFTYIGDVVEGVARIAGSTQKTAMHTASMAIAAKTATAMAAAAGIATGGNAEPLSAATGGVAAAKPTGYRVFNLGNGHPVNLMEFITALERAFGRRAAKRFLLLQPGDVVSTHADTEDFYRVTGFRPATPLAQGVERFAEWYREYHIDNGADHGGESRRGEEHDCGKGRYANQPG